MKKKQCVLLISKNFGFHCLQIIAKLNHDYVGAVVTINDVHDTRSALSEIVEYCKVNAFEHHIFSDFESLTLLIERLKPELIFVAGWYRILPLEILKKATLGGIGFHFSLLPKYRGGAPVVWSIINGEKDTGFSLLQLDEGMDAGKIYVQERIAIGENDNIVDVLNAVEEKALNALSSNFVDIIEDRARPWPQTGIPSFAAQRVPEDGRIDWHWSAIRIYNFIRAQSPPYPGAFTLANGHKISVFKASLPPEIYYATPGQVVSFSEQGVLVGTGDERVLRIEEIGPQEAWPLLKNMRLRLL